ncbi:MAG TPA: hypothetical protein VG429_03680 [Casimicrobiaceae bacterium]|nr:hypothetical protein [Casimicrobiaceae bacterium]
MTEALLVRHQSILAYAQYRYLKLAAALTIAAIALYAWDRPPNGPYGGTWLGYTLGTIGALLIGWLLWFGVRKRQFGSTIGTLQGWLSAHVYFGTTLIVIATLHAAFKVGWNVHTLAYVLMLAVIGSGFFGVYAYLRYPRIMTDNLGDDTLEMLVIKIADLDKQARRFALSLPDSISNLVLAAAQGTSIGGSWWRQLRGTAPGCPTDAAVVGVQNFGRKLAGEQAKTNHQLYTLLLKKQELVARARRDVKLKAWLDVWLYVHVPLSIALLVALAIHVVSVFFYW